MSDEFRDQSITCLESGSRKNKYNVDSPKNFSKSHHFLTHATRMTVTIYVVFFIHQSTCIKHGPYGLIVRKFEMLIVIVSQFAADSSERPGLVQPRDHHSSPGYFEPVYLHNSWSDYGAPTAHRVVNRSPTQHSLYRYENLHFRRNDRMTAEIINNVRIFSCQESLLGGLLRSSASEYRST
ncbi:hypothetical protein BDD12DRAFT_805788 [Trichophaea hybrida]|nr:hypothetical protein BDD12DRAFT_805788 [Trichophaea hybrida]